MKIVNFVLAVMFLYFAFLQVDDPDPFIWILVYGAMAALAVMAMFNFFLRKAILGLLILYTAYSLVFLGGVRQWFASDEKDLLFDDIAKMQYPYIEQTREFMGLWVCIIVLIMYFIQSRRSAAKTGS